MPAAALLYVVLALLATWPLVMHLRDRVPGSDSWDSKPLFFETPVNIWNLWWFRHALLDLGQNPFACRYLFYPFGVDLWLHTFTPLHGLYGVLLQVFVPLIVAQNLIVLGSLVAAGCCTYALGRALGLEQHGALLAGGIYAFCPPVFAHLYVGHFELTATYWLPAILLVFLHLIERPRLQTGAGLGLLFAAAAYSSQYYALYGAELLVVAGLVAGGRLFRPAVLGSLAVAFLIAAATTAPQLLALLGKTAEQTVAVDPSSFYRHSADLVGFVIPSFNHPLLGTPLRSLHERLNAGRLPQETTAFVGWSVLGLAMLGLWRRRPDQIGVIRLLAATAAVFAVLALGSGLRVLGTDTGIPLPMALMAQLPVLDQARAPGRHIVLVILALALLAGLGWPTLRHLPVRLAVLGLLVCEYAGFPIPLYVAETSPVYRRLAEVGGHFAILELPFGIRDGFGAAGEPDASQMFGQTIHGHPIASGMVSRLPVETRRAIFDAPVLGTLLDPQGATPAAYSRDRALGPGFFERVDLRAVVVHRQARDNSKERYLEDVLPVRSRETFPDGSELLWLGNRTPQ
jgi:hypothetical protein